MRCMRFVVPSIVLAVFVVTLAHSQTDRTVVSKLLDNLKRGDSVTLITSRATGRISGGPGGGYSIRVLTEDELTEIRAEAEQYEEKVREYEEKQEANRDELRTLSEEARRDPQKRVELMNQMRSMSRPRRPDSVYQVFVVGDDYVGLRTKGSEILIPISNIASIRRQIDTL
jgi:hypothetical protein